MKSSTLPLVSGTPAADTFTHESAEHSKETSRLLERLNSCSIWLRKALGFQRFAFTESDRIRKNEERLKKLCGIWGICSILLFPILLFAFGVDHLGESIWRSLVGCFILSIGFAIFGWLKHIPSGFTGTPTKGIGGKL